MPTRCPRACGLSDSHIAKRDGITSPRVRGEVDRVKRGRVRGPFNESELTNGHSITAQAREKAPSPRPSPRRRGEGAEAPCHITSAQPRCVNTTEQAGEGVQGLGGTLLRYLSVSRGLARRPM